MADRIFTAIYRTGCAFLKVGILSAAGEAESAAVTITTGNGAPSAAEPDGSIYLRRNGTNADDSLYMRIGGAWVAMKCQTA